MENEQEKKTIHIINSPLSPIKTNSLKISVLDHYSRFGGEFEKNRNRAIFEQKEHSFKQVTSIIGEEISGFRKSPTVTVTQLAAGCYFDVASIVQFRYLYN